MKKKAKKIIGISILISVFIALFVFTVAQSGLTEALKGWGLAIAITIIIAIGSYFATGN